MIKTVDGESWYFDETHVQFKQLRTDSIILVIAGEEVSIPLSKVAVIRLPELN